MGAWPARMLLAGLPHILPGDPGLAYFTAEDYYPVYAAMAHIVKPVSVLEVGVRLGYSLVALYRGYSDIKRIVGVDNEGGLPGSQAAAGANLRAAGYAGDLVLPVAYSQRYLDGVPRAAFDLVHVDGDHEFNWAVFDVWEAWKAVRPGGWLVVDDADYPPQAQAIAAAFGCIFDCGYRGHLKFLHQWTVARKT